MNEILSELDSYAIEYQNSIKDLTECKKVSYISADKVYTTSLVAQEFYNFFLANSLGIPLPTFKNRSNNVNEALSCAKKEDLKKFLCAWVSGFVDPTNQMFKNIDIRKEKHPDYSAWHLLYKTNRIVCDIGMAIFVEYDKKTSSQNHNTTIK